MRIREDDAEIVKDPLLAQAPAAPSSAAAIAAPISAFVNRVTATP
jgi:hypothetical protein